MKAIKLKRGDDVITTSVPREQVRLRAAGYVEVPMNTPTPDTEKKPENNNPKK